MWSVRLHSRSNFCPNRLALPTDAPVGVERVVAVNRLRQIDAQAVDMHFLDQKRRAADELLADDFFPEPRREPDGAVVQIAAVR